MKVIRSNCFHNQFNWVLVFFQFLHSATAILLLLLVGQVINKADSTKAKLLKMIFNADIFNVNIWLLVFGLIVLKFLATFYKNYFYQFVSFQLYNKIQNQLLYSFWSSDYHSVESLTNKYVKAFIKGILFLFGDLFLLIFIFILLIKLNQLIALYWLLFLISGFLFRFLVVGFFLNAKLQYKNSLSIWRKKWNFLFVNKIVLFQNMQFEKELNIFNNRKLFAERNMKKFGLQLAWTAGFFPTYFYLFLFYMAMNLSSFQITQTNSLQIVLLIIYSQSALMRVFKVPAYLKELKEIENKWTEIGLNVDSKKVDELEKLNNKSSNLMHFSTDNWVNIVKEHFIKKSGDLTGSIEIYKTIYVLDLEKELIGETYLSAILTNKENIQTPLLESIVSSLELKEFENFVWKSELKIQKLTYSQKIWLHLLKSILHPGNYILFIESEDHKIPTETLTIFNKYLHEINKKLYTLKKEDIMD